ncbi:type II secretion system F family protein [Phycisphaeraceae bacterium D3-23]
MPHATSYRFTAQTVGEEVGTAHRLSARPVSGAIDADNADAAQSSLAAMGLRVVSLEPSAGGGRSCAVRGSDFVAFNQQLAHLTEAGLPMEQGLSLIAQDLKRGRLKNTIEQVADELRSGKDLAAAFAAHKGAFPPLYGAILEAGVKTGNLPSVLMGLGQHLELLQRLRSAVWRAAAYPLVVLVGVLTMLGILGAVLVPQFKEIFDDFDTTLPLITEVIFALADAMPYLVGGLLVLAVLLAVGASALRTAGKGQALLDAILWLPLIGPAIRKNLLSRWCDALRLALHAGLDLPASLRLAAGTVGSRPLTRDTDTLIATLEAGQPIHLADNIGFIPPAVPAAIELAAHADDLPGMLHNLAAMYHQQAEARVAALQMVLGPLMLILVAAIIGITIWALFMPLVKLMQAVM